VFGFLRQRLSETFLILRRNHPNIIINVHDNYPLFLSDFNEACIFSTDFVNILKFQILGIPECSMQTDGQTERYDEANSRFS